MENNDKIESKIITLLRFPLAILVVFCHNKILWGVSTNGILHTNDGYILQSIQIFFSEVIPHTAVPIFLFFSGYLFFNKIPFTKDIYISKLKTRMRSLLLPYIIWCSIGYIIAVLNNECTLSLLSFIQGLWDTSLWNVGTGTSKIAFSNMPADMPLWFIRDLIIMVILSPLVYYIITRLKSVGVILLGLWWYSHIIPKPFGFGADTFFFFSLGAWFAIRKINFSNINRKAGIPLLLITIILMITDFLIVNQKFTELGRMDYNWYIFNAFILTGSISVIYISSYIVRKKKSNISSFWAPASFFLFSAHALYMKPVRECLFSLLNPCTQMGWITFYFTDILVIILIALIAFFIIRKYMPALCKILTGGRI